MDAYDDARKNAAAAAVLTAAGWTWVDDGAGHWEAPPAQAVDLGPGLDAAAKLIQKKADDYAEEFGYDDMGGLSFGRGHHAEVKSDHHSFMLELVDELRALIDGQAVGK